MHDLVLAYFEAIDADNWDRVDDILSLAQQDEMLSAAIWFLHEKLEHLSDVPYVKQIMEWREREKGRKDSLSKLVECQKGDIVAYKRFRDFPGGTLSANVRFGIFQEFSIRTVEGYDAKEWVIIIMENGENGCIIPSQVVNVFQDRVG